MSVVNATDSLSADTISSETKNSEKPAPKIKYSKITESEKDVDIAFNSEIVTHNGIGEISEKFVAALQAKDTDQFYDNLNVEVIVQESLTGAIQKLDNLSNERDNIIRGIIAIPEILISKIGQRGHIKYLRLVKHKNDYRGLVRIKYNNGELSYFELLVKKDKSGDPKIIDYTDLMLGRSYTKIVSQMLIKADEKIKQTDKILIYSTEPNNFQDRYAYTIRQYQHGEYQKALESFQKLPVKFKNTRDILLLQAQIAKASSRNAYREALVLLENKFSKDSDLGLLLSDHYFFTKQYNQALKVLESFSLYIGGDIAIESLRVKILLSQNLFEQAITIGADAIKEDDSYEDIYWLLLKSYLHTYQYQQVSNTLDVLLDKFDANFEIEKFYKDPFYREYGFSKQFKKWKEKRKSEVK
jgi:hypothetical protein